MSGLPTSIATSGSTDALVVMASVPAAGGPKGTPPIQAQAAPGGGGGGSGSGGGVFGDERAGAEQQSSSESDPTAAERQEIDKARQEAITQCDEAQEDLRLALGDPVDPATQAARGSVACHFLIHPDDPNYRELVEGRIRDYDRIKASLANNDVKYVMDGHFRVRPSESLIRVDRSKPHASSSYIDEHSHIALGVKDYHYRQPRNIPQTIWGPIDEWVQGRTPPRLGDCAPGSVGADSFQHFADDARKRRRRSLGWRWPWT